MLGNVSCRRQHRDVRGSRWIALSSAGWRMFWMLWNMSHITLSADGVVTVQEAAELFPALFQQPRLSILMVSSSEMVWLRTGTDKSRCFTRVQEVSDEQ